MQSWTIAPALHSSLVATPNELGPRLRWAAVEIPLLPVPLRMDAQELLHIEGCPISAAEAPPHRHVLRHGRRGDLPLDRSGRVEGDVPDCVGVTDVLHGVRVVVRADGA